MVTRLLDIKSLYALRRISLPRGETAVNMYRLMHYTVHGFLGAIGQTERKESWDTEKFYNLQ